MALRVWLPLSGNTINIGLDNTETSVIGNVEYTTGIFGNRSFLSGNGTVIGRFNSIPVIAFTISLWFKALNNNPNATLISFGNIGEHIALDTTQNAYVWRSFTGHGLLPDGTKLFDNVSNNVWNCLVLSADGTNVRVYLNGDLVTTLDQSNAIATAFGLDHSLYIGSRADYTNKWNGQIQDVKFYDHAFSKKEVTETSRGMVLEYTFNHNGFGSNRNLLNGSCGKFELDNDQQQVVTIEDDSMYAVLLPGTYTLSAYTDGAWASTAEGSPNADNDDRSSVLVSLELYTKVGDVIDTRTFCDLSENGSYTFNVNTFTTFYIGASLYGDGISHLTASIYYPKIEVGEKQTFWVPPKGSEMYDKFKIATEEDDTSGNRMHGEISFITPIWSLNTRIFSGCYDFSNNAFIKTPELDTTELDKFTICVWAKSDNMSNKILFGFNSGSRFNFSTMDGTFGVYDVSSSRQIVFGKGTAPSSYNDDWHWYVITGNGGIKKLYIDGEFKGMLDGNVELGSGTLYINGWDATTEYNFNGLMSDFRIYATEFQPELIKTMAHQVAAVDNNSQLYAFEYKDSDKTSVFNRNGVVESQMITVFDPPVEPEDTTGTNATGFRIARSKVTAVNIIES